MGEEVPEDILKTAEALYAPYSYLADGPGEDDVARLILAERQRCAKIALQQAEEQEAIADRLRANSADGRTDGSDTIAIARANAARRVAKAIEEGRKP